ncbi:MAG: hypoxanthine phosphoribosyltransferase [Candidatus Methylomirabilis sp.]|nr:hypoxanthine phosphoribosyltransferase [Deltaproteobacteria bacterium]
MNLKPFIPPQGINEIVERLARQINSDYRGRTPLLVGVLKGAFLFLSDLVRKLEVGHEVDFIQTACYGHRDTPAADVLIVRDITADLSGRDVIIVEDIIDRGHTAQALMKYFSDRGAASIRLCTLLKREGGAPELRADYIGAVIGPGFVVGYGMDHKEMLRGLPGLYTIQDDEGEPWMDLPGS